MIRAKLVNIANSYSRRDKSRSLFILAVESQQQNHIELGTTTPTVITDESEEEEQQQQQSTQNGQNSSTQKEQTAIQSEQNDHATSNSIQRPGISDAFFFQFMVEAVFKSRHWPKFTFFFRLKIYTHFTRWKASRAAKKGGRRLNGISLTGKEFVKLIREIPKTL